MPSFCVWSSDEIKSESLFLLVNIQVDRTATKVTVVPQKEKKDYSFQENILDLVVDCLDKGVVPNPEVTIQTFIYFYSGLPFISVSYWPSSGQEEKTYICEGKMVENIFRVLNLCVRTTLWRNMPREWKRPNLAAESD